MKIYWLYLSVSLTINKESEINNLNTYFNTNKIKEGKYTLFLTVLGDSKINDFSHSLIPVGEINSIGLIKHGKIVCEKEIKNVFDFQLNEQTYNEQRELIKSWFYEILDKNG